MTEATRGRLVAFEGIDGSGKSTQAALLAERLGAVLTYEPGATPLGSSLRRLLLDPDRAAVGERAEALLMAADRAQHVVEVVEPELARGVWVVTDRFSASTLAYQGYGRGLDLAELEMLVSWATDGLVPDLTVLVDVPVPVALGRRGSAGEDRFESQDGGFHQRVADGFHALAARATSPWLVVDGSRPVEEVAAEVARRAERILGAGRTDAR